MNTQIDTSRDVSKLVREIFLDDLDMPVSSVAKIIAEQTGETLSETQINSIKSDVERRIARALPVAEPRQQEQEYFTNRPRLVVGNKNKMTKDTAMARKGRALVDVTEKRKWLNDWALENGGQATIKEAKEALQKQFGEALGTSYIAQTLKDARQLLLEERRRQRHEAATVAVPENLTVAAVPSPTAQPSLRETIRSIASLMRVSGIRKLEILPDGTVNFEASTST